jgi:UrcA family protein
MLCLDRRQLRRPIEGIQTMARLSPLALAGALIATGMTVLSSSPVQATAMRVHYGDLDLSTTAGRVALDARINRAARVVCRVENRDLAGAEGCRRESVARAHVALDRALLDNAVQLASR